MKYTFQPWAKNQTGNLSSSELDNKFSKIPMEVMSKNKMQRRHFVSLLLGSPVLSRLLLPQVLYGTEASMENPPAVDGLKDIIEPAREKSDLPGIAAGVSIKGNLVALGVSGVRRIDREVALQPTDKFPIGSCTKAMAATLMAILVEEGKIRWETPIAEAFPERAAQMHPDCRDITIEMMLQMRSGLDSKNHFPEKSPPYKAPIQTYRLETLDALTKNPPVSKPGSTFNYTGAGYVICAAILERITGKAWEELMQERLFRPLAMTSAGFGLPTQWDRSDQPLGHILRENKYVLGHGSLPAVHGPAGTAYCSIQDYLKFADSHASQGARGPRILAPSTYAKLQTPGPEQDYAMGWYVRQAKWAKGTVLNHNGITYDQGNSFLVFIGQKIGVSIATTATAYVPDNRVFKVLGEICDAMEHRFSESGR